MERLDGGEGGAFGGNTSGRLAEYSPFIVFFFLVAEEFRVFFLLCSAVAVVGNLGARTASRHIDFFRLVEQLFEFSVCHQLIT